MTKSTFSNGDTMKLLVTLLSISLIAVSCDTTGTGGAAQQLTLEELNSVPGYAWFPAEMVSYDPSAEMIDSINTRFDANEHKIYVFVKPSCSCRGTQKLFPQIMKTITESNIPMENVEIWSMRSTTDEHPHMSQMTVTDLPVVFVIRNDEVASQILDAQYSTTNADTLVANSLLP